MDKDLKIRISIDENTGAVKVVKNEFDGLGKSVDSASKSSDDFTNRLRDMAHVSVGIYAIKQAFDTLSAGVQYYVKTADEMTNVTSRLNLVTHSTDELTNAYNELFAISQDTRTSFKDTADLYSTLGRSTESLHVSQARLLNITDTISKSMIISGGSAESMKAALIQLGQGLGSGTLRGEELNSVMEQSPRLAKAIADGMGITIGQLRKYAEENKLTSENVVKAIESQSKAITKEFGTMSMTVEQSFTTLSNSSARLIDDFNKTYGVTELLASSISNFSKELDGLDADMLANRVANVKSSFDALEITISVLGDTYEDLKKSFDTSNFINLKNSIEFVSGAFVLGGVGAKNGLLMLKESALGIYRVYAEVYNYISQGWIDLFTRFESVAKFVGLDEYAKSINEFKRGFDKIDTNAIDESIRKNESYITSIDEINKKLDTTKQKIDNTFSYHKNDEGSINFRNASFSGFNVEAIEGSYNYLNSKRDELVKRYANDNKRLLEIDEDYDRALKELNKASLDAYNGTLEKKEKAKKTVDDKAIENAKKVQEQIIDEYEAMYEKQAKVDEAYTKSVLSSYEELYLKQGDLAKAWAIKEDEIRKEYSSIFTKEDLESYIKLSKDEYFDKLVKEQEKTVKVMNNIFIDDLFENIEKAMDEQFFDVMTGKFNSATDFIKDMFESLWESVARGFARTLSGDLVSGAKSFLLPTASAIPTFASASEASSWLSNSANTSSYTQKAITQAQKLASGGQVNDVNSLLSNASSLKSGYSLLTGGLLSSIYAPFGAVSEGLSGLGLTSLSSGVADFGAGFSSVFAPNTSFMGASAMGAGQLLGGGALGYGMGSLGDMIFGADTKASTFGAIGGAIGTVIAPGIGTLLGSALGSIVGGFFGSTKATGSGIYAPTSMGLGDVSDIQTYTDYKKKSWFSSSSWTTYSSMSASEKSKINGIFSTYEYLLDTLGQGSKNIVISAGRYSVNDLGDAITKEFIKQYTGTFKQSIYDSWVAYAVEINKTTTEALTQSIGQMITTKRGFEEFKYSFKDDDLGLLSYKASYLKNDFENLAKMMGVSGLSIDNFSQKMSASIKNNFTHQNIEQWNSLSEAMQSATNALKSYKDELLKDELSKLDYKLSLNSLFGEMKTTLTNVWNLSSQTLDSLIGDAQALLNAQDVSTLSSSQKIDYYNTNASSFTDKYLKDGKLVFSDATVFQEDYKTFLSSVSSGYEAIKSWSVGDSASVNAKADLDEMLRGVNEAFTAMKNTQPRVNNVDVLKGYRTSINDASLTLNDIKKVSSIDGLNIADKYDFLSLFNSTTEATDAFNTLRLQSDNISVKGSSLEDTLKALKERTGDTNQTLQDMFSSLVDLLKEARKTRMLLEAS